jgi:hypothetical protein
VTQFEFALRLDCEKEGCDPKHADDGEVLPFLRGEGRSTAVVWQTINGHAARLLYRPIPDWIEVPE